MRSTTRVAAVVAVLTAATAGLAGCTPVGPLGLRRDGDRVTVVLGRQCGPGAYLTKLTVYNYDRRRNDDVRPPLWVIEATRAHAVPSVVLGTVPDGYTETANNIATEKVGAALEVIANLDNVATMVFDLAKVPDGKVLDASGKVSTEAAFRKANGC
jgi:hypothetical protein